MRSITESVLAEFKGTNMSGSLFVENEEMVVKDTAEQDKDVFDSDEYAGSFIEGLQRNAGDKPEES